MAFRSVATNLVAGDTNGTDDIFVRDRQTGTTERINLGPAGAQALGGPSTQPSISADGRYVAFVSSATNLVVNDTNGVSDIFVRDRETATTTRVSVATGGTQATGGSGGPAISRSGRYVVFASSAINLVAGDTNGHVDVFRHDRASGTTCQRHGH